MDSNQNDIDFLAEQTFILSDSLKNRTHTSSSEFDEDLIEFEKFKDSFVFAPVEDNFQDENIQGPTLEELEALCVGVFGCDEEIGPGEESSSEEIIAHTPSFFTPYEEVRHFDIDFTIPEVDDVIDVVIDLCAEEEQVIEDDLPAVELEKTPGIIYNVLVGTSTFCVKSFCSADLSSFEMNDLIQNRLRLDEREIPHFFITPSLERAEVLADQIANRRFTTHEDMICNIGDPGFSWWLEKRDHGLSIYFKSYKVNRVDEAIRLGPIGDVQVAVARLSKIGKVFRSFFPISEFSCDENALHLSTSYSDNESMEKLISLFEHGEFLFDSTQFPLDREGETLFLYLQELSDARSWWLEIESIVNS